MKVTKKVNLLKKGTLEVQFEPKVRKNEIILNKITKCYSRL